MSQRKYRAISLFSGAMGLDLGLELSRRFRIVGCVEKEKAFCDTIRANISSGRLDTSLKVFEGDISNIDPIEVLNAVGMKPGDLDLLVGGPPCQSFSTAGRRGTIQDARGTLLWQYLRFVEAIKPKFFLMENVRGLLSAALRHRSIATRPDKGGAALMLDEQPGSVVRQFANDLQSMNEVSYHMDCFEVNAVNYGAPQLRERALFIGNRFGEVVEFPNPTHGPKNGSETAPSLFEVADDRLLPWATLRDAIGSLVETDRVLMNFSPRKLEYLGKIPPGSNWRSLPVEAQKESMGKAWFAKGGRSGWWRRLSFDLPAPTLVTMPNHASTALCHPTETRALTLREYARIQEFPDDWIVCGTTSQQYAQIGNAVPVRLGRVAGEVIASKLDALESRGWTVAANPPSDFRVIYIQSHIRTRQWFRKGQTLVWDDNEASGNPTYATPRTQRKSRAI